MDEQLQTTPPQPPEHSTKRTWTDPHLSFGGFLVVVLLVSAAVLFVGIQLYVHSDLYKLDITRPGFKGIKSNELVQVNSSQKYDSSSPLSREAMAKEQQSIDKRMDDLDHYADFKDKSLSNTRNTLFHSPRQPSQ